jgi:hypothetical protein
MNLLISLLFSVNSYSMPISVGLPWTDLKEGSQFYSVEPISIELESGETFNIDKESQLDFKGWVSLLHGVLLYEFHQKRCEVPEATSSLELYTLTPDQYEIGIQIDQNCLIQFFIMTYEQNLLSPLTPL